MLRQSQISILPSLFFLCVSIHCKMAASNVTKVKADAEKKLYHLTFWFVDEIE